jgi:CBS domain-containing protein
MSVGRLCSRVVATATPEESARVAARRMAEHDVGTLVVVEPDGVSRALGIVTDRDLVVRCVAGTRDPESTKVRDLMTAPAHCIDEDTPIEEAVRQMAAAGTRRLVVTGGRWMVRILSLTTFSELIIGETTSIGRFRKQRPSNQRGRGPAGIRLLEQEAVVLDR